jgi:hypothetical protein
MVTSTALVALPVTTLTTTTAVAIADSDPVLVGALPRLSPGTSLATVHGEVQVRSLTPYVLSVSARADTVAQAEATANAVAESYIGYAGAAGSPAGHVPAVMLQPAMSASGAAAGRRDARRGIRGADRSHRGARESTADAASSSAASASTSELTNSTLPACTWLDAKALQAALAGWTAISASAWPRVEMTRPGCHRRATMVPLSPTA